MSWSIRCRTNSFFDVISRSFLPANHVIRTCRCSNPADNRRSSTSSSTTEAEDATTAVEEPLVLEQTHGDVALIGINRPHVRNCVNLATGASLRSALERFDADYGLKSAVLHGVGGNFCAGFDLSELATMDVKTTKTEEDSEATTLEATLAQRAIADPL